MSLGHEREFASRDELIAYVREQFPRRKNPGQQRTPNPRRAISSRDSPRNKFSPASTPQPAFPHGAVTRLSPYLRYGVLKLGGSRHAVLEKVWYREEAVKLVNELGWRYYWQ